MPDIRHDDDDDDDDDSGHHSPGCFLTSLLCQTELRILPRRLQRVLLDEFGPQSKALSFANWVVCNTMLNVSLWGSLQLWCACIIQQQFNQNVTCMLHAHVDNIILRIFA